MSNSIDRIKNFLTDLFLPIIVVLFCNTGLIFGIKNQVPRFRQEVQWLSLEVSNDHSIEIFVAVATIFILFFAFAQLGYSLRHIPQFFITRYLLWHKKSLSYVAFQFSFVFIAVFFSTKQTIHNINWLLILLLIPSSLIITLSFFKWLTHALTLEGMVKIILGTIREKDITKFEKRLDQGIVAFENALPKEPLLSIITDPLTHYYLRGRYPTINSTKRGYVASIDVVGVTKAVNQIRADLDKLELGATVGKSFPGEHNFLIRVVPKILETNNNPAIVAQNVQREQRVKKFVETKGHLLENCFEFDDDEYNSLEVPFNDMLDAYEHISQETPKDLKKLVELLTHFFRDKIWVSITGQQKQ